MKLDNRNLCDRSGVALILVIGLLALMMVMGVAFAIYMRTERVAAGNFKNDVKTRQLLSVALNRALQDIETTVGSSNYPSWEVLSSQGYGDATSMTNGVALKCIPAGPVIAGNPVQPKWQDVDISVAGVEGRFAYVVANCSGLLDINQVGGGERFFGTNVSEIQISNVTEIENTNDLFELRPFFTVQELNTYGLSNGVLSQSSIVCSDYSRAVIDTSTAYIGGTGDWSSAATIIQAFINSGVDPASAGLVYTNLLDYVDVDSIPHSLDSGATESVPMVNEVKLTYEFTYNVDRTWESGLQCEVEWAYPFQSCGSDDYKLKANISFEALPGNSCSGFVPAAVSNTADIGVINVPNSYGVVNALADALVLSGGPTNVTRVHFQCNVSLQVVLGDGSVCDAVPAGTGLPMKFEIDLPSLIANGATQAKVKWMECIDPRFNWGPDDQACWLTGEDVAELVPGAAPTPNAINNITTYQFQSLLDDFDRDLHMHVANHQLRSVGELGFLAYAPLKTLRLYAHSQFAATNQPEGQQYHLVLDKFRVVTNAYYEGLVNPNSPYQDVLTAAFLDMPMQEWGSTVLDQVRLSDSEAENVASNVRLNRLYGKLSDLGKMDWNAFVPGGGNELKAESFLRNTCGLLSVRQNYFIILLNVQTTKVVAMMSDRSVAAGIRAVAEVWRDPVKTEGRNPIVVKSFMILNE